MLLTLDQMRVFPGDDLEEIPRASMREINARLVDSTRTLPTDYGPYAQQVVVVAGDGSGPIPAPDLTTDLLFGLRPVRGWRPAEVPVTASIPVTDWDHAGAVLMCHHATTPIVLTFAVSGNPLTGISLPFCCRIRRRHGSAAVQIALTEISNRSPGGHTRVVAARAAEIHITAASGSAEAYFDGYTAP